MEVELADYIKTNGFSYIKIENPETIECIYNYYFRVQEVNTTCTDSFYFHYIGFYHYMKKEFDLMKQYCLMAIERGNRVTMGNLALYYESVENYDLMKHYYLMAIEKGSVHGMNNLGHYYQNVEKNYDSMKHYYLMAIEQGNASAMSNLASYYQVVEKGNYELMKQYYLMAIEKGNASAMGNLALYYESVEKNYDLMKQYCLMAIEKGHLLSMTNLASYYQYIEKNYDLAEKYYLMAVEHGDTRASLNILRMKKEYDKILELDSDLVRKELPRLYQFHCARKSLIRNGVCDICYEEKPLYPYDCICHYMCLNCYLKVNVCGLCLCPKNTHFTTLI